MKKTFLIIPILILTILVGYTLKENKRLDKTTKEISLSKKTSLKESNENNIYKENNLLEEDVLSSDEEVVSYIANIEQDVTTLTSKKNLTEENETTLKDTFITLTDFIFYNGTIKGKTFTELKTETKEKVLVLWSSIDQKIETKIPNYKETIKEVSKKTYKNIKEKAISLKESLKNKYKEEVGQDSYDETLKTYEEDKNNLKETYEFYRPAVEKVKEKTKEEVSTIKDNAKTWYSNLKESR